jgi:hypothetical protein
MLSYVIEQDPFDKTLPFKTFATLLLSKSMSVLLVSISYACTKCANLMKANLVNNKKQNNCAKVSLIKPHLSNLLIVVYVVLLSLIEFYDDLREEGIETENEAEFRAYYMISHIRDQDVARQAQTLPINIFRHPYLQRALEFHALAQRNNEIMETSSRRNKPLNTEACQNFYSTFFRLIADPNTTFLMACMLECHFADVRKGALKAMNVSYMMKAGGVEAEYVRQVLAYDTLQQLLQEVHLYGISIDMSLNEPTIRFGQKHYRTKVPIFVGKLIRCFEIHRPNGIFH